jgi:hypothetical protein
MINQLSKLVDKLSEFLASRKGLLPMVGIVLIAINFILRLVPGGWFASTDFFLHLGIIVAILGFMLAWAL